MKPYYTSKRYTPEAVVARYVRFDGTAYRFCEVGADRRFDLRQGYVSESELPSYVAARARRRFGSYPGYVEWPIVAVDVQAKALERFK